MHTHKRAATRTRRISFGAAFIASFITTFALTSLYIPAQIIGTTARQSHRASGYLYGPLPLPAHNAAPPAVVSADLEEDPATMQSGAPRLTLIDASVQPTLFRKKAAKNQKFMQFTLNVEFRGMNYAFEEPMTVVVDAPALFNGR